MRAQQQPNAQTLRLFELVRAEQEPNIDQVMRALDAGAEVDRADNDGMTPLRRAAEKGHATTALALIERGAEVDRVDNSGRTPLHYAAELGRTATALALIERGAEVDRAGNDGMTPLHCAAYSGRTAIALALIERGAEVNRVDNDGMTPLHHAAERGRTATALVLIEKGAEVDRADNSGMTPLKHVMGFGAHPEFTTLLLVKGADPFLAYPCNIFESLAAMGPLDDENMLSIDDENLQHLKSVLTALAITKAVDIRTAEDGNPIIQIRKRTPGGDIVDADDGDMKLERDDIEEEYTPQITILENLRHATRLISQIAGNARTILSHPAQPAGEEPIELTQAKERFIASILTPPEGFDPSAPNAVSDLNAIRTTAARLIAARGHSDLLLEALKRGPEHPEALSPIARGLLEVCPLDSLAKALSSSKRLSYATDALLEAKFDLRFQAELGVIYSAAYRPEVAGMVLQRLKNRGIKDLPANQAELQARAGEWLAYMRSPDLEGVAPGQSSFGLQALADELRKDGAPLAGAAPIAQAPQEEIDLRARLAAIKAEADRVARHMAILEEGINLNAIPVEEVGKILELMPYVLDEVDNPAACEAARERFNPRTVQLLQTAARQYDERVRAGQDIEIGEDPAAIRAGSARDIERAADKAIEEVNHRAMQLREAIAVLNPQAAAQAAPGAVVGQPQAGGAPEAMEVDAAPGGVPPIGAPAPNVAQPKARAPRGPAIKRPRED